MMEYLQRRGGCTCRPLLRLILLCSVPLFLSFPSEVSAFIINVDQAHQMIHTRALVFEDAEGGLSCTSILSLPEGSFVPNDSGTSFGFSSAAYWFRLDFEHSGNKNAKRLLVFETPWMDSIQLYGPVQEMPLAMRELGDRLLYHMRTRASPRFVFELVLPPGSSTFYARVFSSQAMMLPMTLWSRKAFEVGARKLAGYFGAIYGAIALMFLYNFLLYLAARDRPYLFYCLYLLSFFLMDFGYNGFSFAFFWPGLPGLANASYSFFIYAFQASGLLFAMAFLDTRSRLPRLHRILSLLVVLECAVCLGTWFGGMELMYNQMAVMLIFIYAPLVALTGFFAWRRGFRAARLFVLASTATLIGSFITALSASGFIPFSFASFHAVEFGILIDITLLALALADRVNIAQREKQEAQEEILGAQSAARVELKNRVDERTKELSLVYELTAYVNQGLTMEDVLDHVYQSLREVVPYERMGLALVEGEMLEAVWSRQGGSSGEGVPGGYSIRLRGSRLEEILKSGRARILPDLEKYFEEHPDSESTAMMLKSGFRSSLTLPLRSRGQALGFLFFTCLRPNTYDESHIHFLMLIGDQLSMIIEKSKLHDEQIRLKTSLEEANAELASLARIDPLTGLANRREFDDGLDHEWRRALRNRTPISFIMLDIDFFKNFNDSQGHQAGDNCLRRVADLLKKSIRRANDLVARYGGEEFGIILPECPPASAREIAEMICRDVAALGIPHRSSAFGFVTLSAGWATLVPERGAGPEELVQKADEALYQAKTSGRNCAVGAAQGPESKL